MHSRWSPLFDELKSQAEHLQLLKRVEFLGAVPYRQVATLMATSDVVVAPSVEAIDGDCEGLPTVLLEAMASQRLVISTPVGGIGLVLEDKVTGRMVRSKGSLALAEAMRECIDHPSEQEALVDQAYEVIQAYNWTEIAARYAKVLNEAVSPHG